MPQKGFGRVWKVACSRVLGASGRSCGYMQPFQTLSETYGTVPIGIGIVSSKQSREEISDIIR